MIDKVGAGDTGRTMMHAAVANEVIDRVNAWDNATVVPSDACEIKKADANIVFDFTNSRLATGGGSGGGVTLPAYPSEDGQYVLGLEVLDGGGTLSWFEVGGCSTDP